MIICNTGCFEPDSDLQKTLCNSSVLNWWLKILQNSTKFIPVKTSSDGNCLCHSIFQKLKATEDKDLRLRTALNNFFKKHDSQLRNLWEDNKIREQKKLGDASCEFTKKELDKEWEQVVMFASPSPKSGSTNYHFLEKIHIFALANLLKSTIIVLATKYVHSAYQPIQINDIAGIYLPFLDKPFSPEIIQPIFIAFHNSHYSSLIAESPSTNYRIPLNDSNGNIPKIHFTDDEFCDDYMKLSVLKNYMCISEDNGFYCTNWPNQTVDVIEHLLPSFLHLSENNEHINLTTQFPEPDFELIKENIYVANIVAEVHSNCECKYNTNETCSEGCINHLLFIECNPKTCVFGQSCKNMTIQKSKPLKGLIICQTSKGYGLATKYAIKKGSFIMEYTGEVISKDAYKARLQSTHNNHFYGMSICDDLVIDATYKGNESRYINHSCLPNCEVQKWTIEGLPRMGIFAKMDIQANKELTFDYKFISFDKSSVVACKCLTTKCRGHLSRKSSKLCSVVLLSRHKLIDNFTIK